MVTDAVRRTGGSRCTERSRCDERHVADVLADAVLEQLEILLPEVRDGPAVLVAHDDVHRNRGGARGKVRLGRGRRLRAENGGKHHDRPAHQSGVDPVNDSQQVAA